MKGVILCFMLSVCFATDLNLDNCKTMHGDSCMECEDRFYLYTTKGQGRCVECPPACELCESRPGTKEVKCLGCIPSAFLEPANDLCYICTDHCKECTHNECSKCTFPYRLKTGKCIAPWRW